jgi:hypothetical protein
MITGPSNLKDENEYFSNFKVCVKDIITRVIRTNLTRIRKIIFNPDNQGTFKFLNERI